MLENNSSSICNMVIRTDSQAAVKTLYSVTALSSLGGTLKVTLLWVWKETMRPDSAYPIVLIAVASERRKKSQVLNRIASRKRDFKALHRPKRDEQTKLDFLEAHIRENR